MLKITSALLLCLTFLVSCSKGSEFATPPDTNNVSVDALTTFTYDSCALEGEINPKVNILLLIDNSTSTNLLSNSTKLAISRAIFYASTKFDYRIYVAPLIRPAGVGVGGTESFASYPAFSGTPTGSMAIPQVASERIDALTFQNPALGSTENGISRMKQLLEYNYNQEHFRRDAHTMTVIISNGDDNEIAYHPQSSAQAFETKLNELKTIKQSNDPNNEFQFRLVSVVAQSNCQTGYVVGRQYRQMSKRLYALYGDSNQRRFFPDTHDLCQGDITKIFDQINSDIDPIKESFQYAVWPVNEEIKTQVDANLIDLSKMEVSRYSVATGQRQVLSQGSDFTYNKNFSGSILTSGHVNDLTHTGHALNLLSPQAQVSTPDCLSIKAPEFVRHYGFIPVAIKPLKESIQLTIDGRNIPESATDGWTLISTFQPSVNVLVPPTPSHITDLKSGYMIRLSGSAIYEDGASVKLTFKKSPNRE